MANIQVKRTLERIAKELHQVRKHVSMYSGIQAKDARAIDRITLNIAEDATWISNEAASWFSGEDPP